jgi:molybdopterin-guanine dinucleotide biosynthesis protein B
MTMRCITTTKDKQRQYLIDEKGQSRPPLVCIVGFSGAGKTTVTVGLVRALKKRGLRVGTVKHDVYGFAMDRPGKDSWRHKQAGASATLITSPSKIGMVMDVDHDHHSLELVPLLRGMDIVIIEGFKRTDLPKIEVFRQKSEKPPACKNDRNLLAVVSDAVLNWCVPQYASSDFEGLAEFVMEHFKLVPLARHGLEQSVCG